MLKRTTARPSRYSGGIFAIVASCYNSRYVDAMLASAMRELKQAGADHIQVVRVPGAFEIPVVAARLARGVSVHASRITHHAPPARGHRPGGSGTSSLDAVICLGVILRGQTSHAAHIGEAVSRALMQIQVETEVPVIHEVLLLENEEQARARCLDKKSNRGTEAAQTALKMARVMKSVRCPVPGGFRAPRQM